MKKEEALKKLDQMRDELADVGRMVDTLPDLEEFESLTQQLASSETNVNELQSELSAKDGEIAAENERPYINHLFDGKSPMSWLTDPERNR